MSVKGSVFAWSMRLLFMLMTLVILNVITVQPMAAQSDDGPVVVSEPVAPLVVNVPDDVLEQEPPGEPVAPPEGVNEPTLGEPPPLQQYVDPVAQTDGEGEFTTEAINLLSNPIQNFGGIQSFSGPPDTVGDIGANHFVQMVNSTQFQIWNKQGTSLLGPATFGNLWPAGAICNSNLGDPIVVYDHLADRWLLSQFANPNHMCIAISQTPDPTAGTWFLYTFNTTVFPDYPKFGVWPDGYYMTTYESPNLGVYVFDRTNMLNGFAASFIKTTISSLGAPGVRDTRILPADLDGPPPPDGTPNYMVRSVDGQQDTGNPTDRIEVYTADVDWNANTLAFTLADTLTPMAFNIMLCNRNGQGVRDCIPEANSDDTIDALSNRPMMQLKYRNFGTYAAMVFNQTINAGGSIPNSLPFTAANEVAGIRWYELRLAGANWAIQQQSTYLPQPINADSEDDLLHRWMGSSAMDKDGNIALAYSVLSPSTDNNFRAFPGIRYTGRSAHDPINTLPQGEKTIFNGTVAAGNNDGTVTPSRWGDYSTLSVDPVDDCTFWFTTHVSAGEANITRVASFRFPDCSETDLSISKTSNPATATAGGLLDYNITVNNLGPNIATNVVVNDVLPAQVSYVSNTDSCVQGPVGTLVCSLGNIPASGNVSFTIRVKVNDDAVANGVTTITNNATVTSNEQDPNTANNTATANTLLADLADLRLSKDCKPDQPMLAGAEAICTLVVENLGPSTARSVTLVDNHVSNGTFTFGTVTTSAGSCVTTPNPQVKSGKVTCNLGNIAPGATVTVQVPLSAANPQDINDSATVSSPTPDPNTANNVAADSVSVLGVSDLGVTKTDTPDPVVAGNQLTYNLTVVNNGPSNASNVVIRDITPAGVTINTVSSSVGTCNAGVPGNAAQPTVCTFNSLAAGASATMQIVVTVLPGTTGLLQNDASVSSDYFDPDNTNNLANAATTVNAVADLGITKVDNPDPVIAGQKLTYEITILNSGPSTAKTVTLSDQLPAEVTYVSATITNGSGTCVLQNVPPNTVFCNLNDLSPNQYVKVFIEVIVKPSTPNGAQITNTATTSSSASDSNPGNNTASAQTLVNTQADLSITKDGRLEYGNPAPRIIYTIKVTNNGSSDAQAVTVVDTLPLTSKKIVYLFDTGNGKCSYALSTHKVTCNVGTVPANTSWSVDIYVDAKGTQGVISNLATVSSTTSDPNAANNTVRKDVNVKGGPGPKAASVDPEQQEQLYLPSIQP